MTGLKAAEIKVEVESRLDRILARALTDDRWETAEDAHEADFRVVICGKAGVVPPSVLKRDRVNAEQRALHAEQIADIVALRDYARMMLPGGSHD